MSDVPVPAWMADAACRGMDTDLFFPHAGGQYAGASDVALEVCASCPVTAECKEYAVAMKAEYGVWGGQVASERGFRGGKRVVPTYRTGCKCEECIATRLAVHREHRTRGT